MKKNTKNKLKLVSLILSGSIVFNTFMPSIVSAIEFNPSGNTGDDETNKEYTAVLEQIQINTIMPLNLEKESEFGEIDVEQNQDNNLVLDGAVRINKKLENGKVEYLNELPEVNLVDDNNNIVATTDIFCESEFTSNPSDLYYITLSNLNIESKKTYKLITTFKDNDNNEISKYITYSGKMMISEGVDAKLQYMSVNNILNIIFECKNGKIEPNTIINGIDVTLKTNVAQNCLDNFMKQYNSPYKQKDFDLAINSLENSFKTYFISFMSNQEDKNSYIYEFLYPSIHTLQIEIKYILDDESGMNTSLTSKDINITYTNDNSYTISNVVNNKIDEIISSIPFGLSLEFELNNNYNKTIESYDYISNILNIKDNSIFVKELPSSFTSGMLNKIKIIELALGSDDYVYNEDSGIIIEINPVISIPKKYTSNQEKLNYATPIIQNYTKNNINESFEIESIKFNDKEENVLDVKFTIKSSTGTFSITDKVILKSIDYLKGDLDKNNIVNANDAAIALDLYKYGNVDEYLEIGDMDNNGIINANDAALILDIYKYGN